MKRILKGLLVLCSATAVFAAAACELPVCEFGEWETVTEATCVAEGLERRECACGEEETRAIPMTDHTWEIKEVLNDATYEAEGLAVYKCVNCPEEKNGAIPMRAMFAGGSGTEADPYLIATAEHLQNVKRKYETYSYYKVADGVTTIDCSGWPTDVNFNGNFDGNGVQLVNLTAALFNKVGYQNTVQDITIKNFTVTVNSTTALVHSLINGGETTFANIDMHGYIEAKYNLGCFYRYGTAQYDTGCSYTVNFIDCQSDVTLVETTGNVPGGLIGHAYEGAGNVFTLNIDDKTAYTGKQYGTATKGHYYMAMASGTVNLTINGEAQEGFAWGKPANVYSGYQKLAIVAATKAEDNSYAIAKQEGAVSMQVSVNTQISAYDADGNKIANEAGITIVLDTKTLTELTESTKVLDAFTTVELIAGSDSYSAEIENGVLKIYIMKSASNTYDGNVTLQVVQYNADGEILSVGSTKIAEITRAVTE